MKNNKTITKRKITGDFIHMLLSRKKDFVEALEILGDMYTKSGNIESSLAIDRMLVNLEPLEPVHYYNLACDYALIDKKEQSMVYLKIAIILGFSDFEYLKEDPDLASLRSDPEYEKLIKKIYSRRF